MASLLNMNGGSLLEKVLPYDAEIEYLQSSGTQYIDTGYQINFSGSVDMEQQAIIAYTVTNVRQLNGANAAGYWGCAYNNKFECRSNILAAVSVGTDYHNISFHYKKETNVGYITFYVDNVAVFSSGVADYNNYNYDIFIYAIGGLNHAAAQFFSNAKIKSYKLLFDDEVVRDFIPVRVGQVGYMYDKVSGQLFGNQGTGSFILGNDI